MMTIFSFLLIKTRIDRGVLLPIRVLLGILYDMYPSTYHIKFNNLRRRLAETERKVRRLMCVSDIPTSNWIGSLWPRRLSTVYSCWPPRTAPDRRQCPSVWTHCTNDWLCRIAAHSILTGLPCLLHVDFSAIIRKWTLSMSGWWPFEFRN